MQGIFTAPYPSITIDFSPRPVFGYTLAGDSALGEYPVDFTVKIQKLMGSTVITLEEQEVTGNTNVLYNGLLVNSQNSVTRMVLDIKKWSHVSRVVKIAEFYSSIIREYTNDDILNMSILEETESSDGTLPVGNISCNEMDLTLQNLEDDFYPSNTNSELHTLVKRNRKLEPSLGFNIDGVDYWTKKGLFWSGDWTVGEQDSGASCSARDRMELLRNVMYEGLIEGQPAEATYWEGKTLKEIAEIILESLTEYMPDLFWDIDSGFGNTVIPIGFFKRKNYFQVIKEIVQAGLGFAYFDNPTSAEADSNPLMKDMLRIKAFESIYVEDADLETEEITKDDYITSMQRARSEEIKNIITVKKKTFEIDTEKNTPVETNDSEELITVQDAGSINENGKLTYDYADNDLIQNEEQAMLIATTILGAFKDQKKDIELQTYGDPTFKIGDGIRVPLYQKNGLDVRGKFVLKKLQSEYDGSLRIGYTGIPAKHTDAIFDIRVVQDTNDALTKWQDSDDAIDNDKQDMG